MFLSYPARSLHLLRTCLAVLVIFTGIRYWQISSAPTDAKQSWANSGSSFKNKFDAQSAPLRHDGNPTVAETDEDPYRGVQYGSGNALSQPSAAPSQSVPSNPVINNDNDDTTESTEQDTGLIPLLDEYAVHPATSSFCASRFTTQWFDIVRQGHQQYCLDSASSRLHCFHTPGDFHNDMHIDSFCVAQNVVYDAKREKFTLDCPVTQKIPLGIPKGPLEFHEYWYHTGPRPIFSEWVSLDDRAGLVRKAKIKGPGMAGVTKAVNKGSSTASSVSAESKAKTGHQPDLRGRPTERDVQQDVEAIRKSQYRPWAAAPVPAPPPSTQLIPNQPSAKPPRTFTVLVKREGSHNIFHSLHEIMSLTQTFDAFRMTRDPSTNQPFFVSPQDVENTQVVIMDEHPDGPYFDLWKLFSGKEPKRIADLANLDVIKSTRRDVGETSQDSPAVQSEDDPKAWLTKPLDNLIVPLAGAANSVWHDDWEKWDCVNELRTVFVRRILDFYGFPPEEPVARLVEGASDLKKKRAVDESGDEDNDDDDRKTAPTTENEAPRSNSDHGEKTEKESVGKPNSGERKPESPNSDSLLALKAGDADTSSQDAQIIPTTEDRVSDATKQSPAKSKPASNDSEKPIASSSTSLLPQDATQDPDSLAPWRPKALRITFIDRKETRRVQDTPALLARARAALAEAKLKVHIRAIDFATLSFREQIALARETDILVGVHGAGLTHTLFMRQDMGTLIEIFPEGFELRCFRAMARDRGLGYYKMHVPVVEKKEDFHVEDVIVPQDKFVEVLEHAAKALDNRPGSFRDFY